MASVPRAAVAMDRPTPITVLIVDDEDDIRNLCRDVVTDSGLRTRTASTTEQALEILDQYAAEPFHVPELRGKLDRVVRLLDIDEENRVLREQLRTRPGFGGLIGVSAKMQRVYRLIEKVSQHNYPVLILGESGTGKELVAGSIHFCGPRRSRPFVPVDCTALVPTLIEAELLAT